MIVKVVCAGTDSFSKLYQRDDDEFLIGVDAGAEILIKNRLPIDLAIGDFDSSSMNMVKSKSKAIIIYHPHKDKSDLELALQYVSSKEFSANNITNKVIEEIIIYNATGKRLDHYHALLNMLVRYIHMPIIAVDDYNRIEIVNSKTTFKKDAYRYISFFAAEEGALISLTGFKYDLKNYHFPLHCSLALSNEVEANEAILETNNKKIFVYRTKG